MKNCSKCGAVIEDDAEYCSRCGASQAEGVFKVAEVAGMLGRGAKRTAAGGVFGAVGGAFFYFIIFLFPLGLGSWMVGVIFALICAVIGAVFSAPSLKFMYLMGYWCVYGFCGYMAFFIIGLGLGNYILAIIIYIIFLIVLLPLTWLWYIVRAGLVTAKPKKVGIIRATKEELVDTVKEIKRFGRR